MRIPSSVFAVGRYALGLVVVAASVLMVSGQDKRPGRTRFDAHDTAAYATRGHDPVRQPGAGLQRRLGEDRDRRYDQRRLQVTDPNGLALDKAGIQTPGTISSSFLAAYIPKGQARVCVLQYARVDGDNRGRHGDPGFGGLGRNDAQPSPSASISIRLRPRRRRVSTPPPRTASAFTVRGT